ncbi:MULTISPECIES: 2-keto-4-pentenoate hydratase [unclassified Nocardioides]|uniref:2-keto-4-pentenoate hydratase n=1 Tax=unclassified Nocardioides TaxID=2615069 RepID=UPI003623E7F8
MTEATVAAHAGTDAIAAAATRLLSAAETGAPVPPVRDLIGRDDVQAAYAVQERVTEARLSSGARVVGRKIGLTSAAVQQQMGIAQPDFGVLFDDMAYDGGDDVPAGAVLQPRAEAEVAFVLKSDLVEGDLDAEQVRAAIDYAVAAIEICGSRVAGWDISFSDTVADNASSGAYVLGPQRLTLDEFEPRDVTMTMTVDGEEVSTGTGAACLGDPIDAVVWLARTARRFGDPLRAGQVILSGALGPMRPIAPGDRVRAVVRPLGAVQFTLINTMGEES